MIIVTGGSTAGGPGGPGGTEYTTGQVVAAPVGGVILGWDGTNVRVVRTDATGILKVDGSGVTQPISAATLPLPTGAATSANQATAIAALASIDTRLAGTLAIAGAVTQSGAWSVGQSGAWNVGVTGTVTVDGSAVTQPISAVSLPLPTGAATSALQTTGNTSLSSIDGKLPAALVGGRLDVNIGASTSLSVTGPLTDAQLRATAVPVSDGGASLTVDGTVAVSSVGGSVAVTGTFWQATQPISAASLPLPTGAATEATVATLLTTTAFQARINTLGQKTMANSTPVVIASDQTVIPVSDNGASLTVDGTVAVSSVSGSVTTAGDVAHGTGDSGNPVKIGFKAETALPTAEADNDRVNGVADRYGRQLVSHADPGMMSWKSYNTTTSATGAAIWTPAAGTRVAITSIVIGSYGTTTGRLILWFGAAGDTTYSAGTDQLVLAASFAPSASSKPGLVFTPAVPIFAATTDHVLRITTDANLSVDVAVYGYEFTP